MIFGYGILLAFLATLTAILALKFNKVVEFFAAATFLTEQKVLIQRIGGLALGTFNTGTGSNTSLTAFRAVFALVSLNIVVFFVFAAHIFRLADLAHKFEAIIALAALELAIPVEVVC